MAMDSTIATNRSLPILGSALQNFCFEVSWFVGGGSVDRYVIQVRERGVVTLPKRVRTRYGLEPDMPVTVVDLDGVLVLSPKVPQVTALASQLAAAMVEADVQLEDLLREWAAERYGGWAASPMHDA